jgi:hypothetical protein
VTPSRNCIALLCLAMLFLVAAPLLLWAILLPLCFIFSLEESVSGPNDEEQGSFLLGSCSLLPARAPPVLS